jgi:uncharacterized coiled-coil protein SlyX
MGLNTAPVGFATVAAPPSVKIEINTADLEKKIENLTAIVAQQQTIMKAYVVIDELEAKQDSLIQDRTEASF